MKDCTREMDERQAAIDERDETLDARKRAGCTDEMTGWMGQETRHG